MIYRILASYNATKMIIYLDESYDLQHTWLLISSLFNPAHHKFHREIKRLLIANKYIVPRGDLKEIKYVHCNNKKVRKLYEKVIDCFMGSESYFSSVVIKTDHTFDLHRYGTSIEPDKVKKERAYRTLAEHLLANELRDATNAVLFLDKMSRCEPEKFLELLRQNFCIPGSGASENLDKPRIRHIQDVVSGAEGYELMGVCDLLQGCILNNLMPIVKVPGKKKGSLEKNNIREYLIGKLGVKDLNLQTWAFNAKNVSEQIRKKFNIRYVEQTKNETDSG